MDYINCAPRSSINGDEANKPICQAYANHGNCKDISCIKSHNVDRIISSQEENQPSKRKKMRIENTADSVGHQNTEDHMSENSKTPQRNVAEASLVRSQDFISYCMRILLRHNRG